MLNISKQTRRVCECVSLLISCFSYQINSPRIIRRRVFEKYALFASKGGFLQPSELSLLDQCFSCFIWCLCRVKLGHKRCGPTEQPYFKHLGRPINEFQRYKDFKTRAAVDVILRSASKCLKVGSGKKKGEVLQDFFPGAEEVSFLSFPQSSVSLPCGSRRWVWEQLGLLSPLVVGLGVLVMATPNQIERVG